MTCRYHKCQLISNSSKIIKNFINKNKSDWKNKLETGKADRFIIVQYLEEELQDFAQHDKRCRITLFFWKSSLLLLEALTPNVLLNKSFKISKSSIIPTVG